MHYSNMEHALELGRETFDVWVLNLIASLFGLMPNDKVDRVFVRNERSHCSISSVDVDAISAIEEEGVVVNTSDVEVAEKFHNTRILIKLFGLHLLNHAAVRIVREVVNAREDLLEIQLVWHSDILHTESLKSHISRNQPPMDKGDNVNGL
ncbi:hypothetical protein GCK72_025340 [Caenorhabditis remanei]|uniref:Uncharacterized protein n=1 Tax=Caenorhabditis remanei TaxID=31234 RepID=A0A6A5G252_CAERE|nr:hypothetical protein GCK72_025340 [Caenorhabditis remanei]KAF1748873.1 hypothetical protein GCK72_025340 [Caenorhabditis remanei]